MHTPLQENINTEFKSSFQKEIIISVVAFANTKGGKVYMGIDDDAKVLGVNIETETVQNYINQIKSATEPSLIVDIEMDTKDGKAILIISIDEFPIKPVAYKGKYYKRVNNSNHQLSLIEIANMHLHSLQLSWDSYISNNIVKTDLDPEKITKFIDRVNKNERFSLNNDHDDALAKLKLIKDGSPTHAAMLLFTKDQNIYNIHVGRFKTASTIVDDKMIRETLYEAVEQSMKYIISWMKVAFEFTGKIQRTEIMEYPVSALRELVINAIIHRDYTSPIDTQIKIFDQHITIFNPGTLYGDITIEKLKTDSYQAQTRNKLIAEAFYLTKDIEKYGSGYTRVRKEIASYPTMFFKYEEMGNGYLVTVGYETQKTTTQETTQETAQETAQETTQETHDNKSTRELILQYIEEDNKITRQTLALKIGVSESAIKQQLSKLKKENILERVGSTKSGSWKVNNDAK